MKRTSSIHGLCDGAAAKRARLARSASERTRAAEATPEPRPDVTPTVVEGERS